MVTEKLVSKNAKNIQEEKQQQQQQKEYKP